MNLVGADHVIHLDPWWNPAVEQQATDRAHRIGQTRPVMVYKLVARGTVEEKDPELQARKRALAEATRDAERMVVDALTREDLEAVFASVGEAEADDGPPDELASSPPDDDQPEPGVAGEASACPPRRTPCSGPTASSPRPASPPSTIWTPRAGPGPPEGLDGRGPAGGRGPDPGPGLPPPLTPPPHGQHQQQPLRHRRARRLGAAAPGAGRPRPCVHPGQARVFDPGVQPHQARLPAEVASPALTGGEGLAVDAHQVLQPEDLLQPTCHAPMQPAIGADEDLPRHLLQARPAGLVPRHEGVIARAARLDHPVRQGQQALGPRPRGLSGS
ncbi:MAG: DEAD/DEAH box helicase [bacterium]